MPAAKSLKADGETSGSFTRKQRCASQFPCFALGFHRIYLSARPQQSGFYEDLGWTAIERNIGRHKLSVLVRDAVPESGRLNRSPP